MCACVQKIDVQTDYNLLLIQVNVGCVPKKVNTGML